MTDKEEYEAAKAETAALEATFAKAYGNKLIDFALKAEIERRGAIDPELVMKLIDRSLCTADVQSDVVLGIGAAVDGICGKYPVLFPGKPVQVHKPTPLPRMYGGK